MQIGELFELCWPSSLSFKLIKVGPIVSDGGLQVGSGGPGSRGEFVNSGCWHFDNVTTSMIDGVRIEHGEPLP